MSPTRLEEAPMSQLEEEPSATAEPDPEELAETSEPLDPEVEASINAAVADLDERQGTEGG
jgi:hypothetical protein